VRAGVRGPPNAGCTIGCRSPPRTRHARKVAIKVLKPELGAALGGERFLQEIMVTARLQHRHILPLFGSREDEGLLYYAMPYVEGESLRDRLTRYGRLSITAACPSRKPSLLRATRRRHSPPPTPRASCTATSSRRTS
jgi:serine/threonine protein kinase